MKFPVYFSKFEILLKGQFYVHGPVPPVKDWTICEHCIFLIFSRKYKVVKPPKYLQIKYGYLFSTAAKI